MGNRNRGHIRSFPAKAGKTERLKQSINEMADELVRSFSEMVSAKTDALNWAIDQLPKMLAEAGLPEMQFKPAEGLYPFMLTGFADLEDEDAEDYTFQGMYPCFMADDELPAGVAQYALLLVVNEDEDEPEEEGSHRIDALLARTGTDDTVCIFDGEDWVELDEMLEDDEDEDDLPFN